MNTVAATANLVGITGIARRLVQDGALDEAAARTAMADATAARQPLPQWFAEKKLVTAAQLAAANALEFGMPLLDVETCEELDPAYAEVAMEIAVS